MTCGSIKHNLISIKHNLISIKPAVAQMGLSDNGGGFEPFTASGVGYRRH
jgi:hypothetical protein